VGRWSFKNFSSQNHLWQREERGWESHTVPMKRARMLVNGYLTLVKKLKLDVGGANRCSVLDIGAGAGYIGATFLEHGYSVLSTEHTQDGIDLINKHNPNLKTELFDISNHESNIDKKFDIIICRELYPFTRVNCFESQLEALNNILNFLDNNGAFCKTPKTSVIID